MAKVRTKQQAKRVTGGIAPRPSPIRRPCFFIKMGFLENKFCSENGPTDLVILVMESHEMIKSLHVHKKVLCGKSEVFKAMLESSERMSEAQTNEITINDFSVTTVTNFVRYLYSSFAHHNTFDDMVQLMCIADKYLVTACEILSENTLRTD